MGSSVRVGCGAQIIDSYIFDDVSIGSNTFIKSSLIGSGVKIDADCTIEGGCLIGPQVTIGEGEELRGVNVSLEGLEGSHSLSSVCSSGRIWPRAEDLMTHSVPGLDKDRSDSEDENERVDVRNYKYARLGQCLLFV